MNAREVMQALLDGKTVCRCDIQYKLIDNELMTKWFSMNEWYHAPWDLNNEGVEIVDEYTLTFKEAMQEAINGKKIVCNRRPVYMYSFNPAGKLIEITPCGSDIASISDVLIKAKWKVVE